MPTAPSLDPSQLVTLGQTPRGTGQHHEEATIDGHSQFATVRSPKAA